MHEIKDPVNRDITFVVCYPVENQAENGEFEYIDAVEVRDLDEVPECMVERIVPAQKYAVFTHKGVVEKIGDTYECIHGVWQPKSGHDLFKAPEFE